MNEGVLIKDGRSLELLNQVDTIVFDKTGTLTEVQPGIGEIYSFSSYEEDDILRFAAIAEHKQNHPLALTILSEAERRGLDIPTPEYGECKLGYGVKAKFEETIVVAGSLRFIHLEGICVPLSVQSLVEATQETGCGLIMVAKDHVLLGCIKLLPSLRPEVKGVIDSLKRCKSIKKIYIISGDMEEPTARLAQDLNTVSYTHLTLPTILLV